MFRRQIGAIERITHLEAQGVARAESARFDSKWLSRFESKVPKFRRLVRRKENFEAIFSGVARAGDRELYSLQLKIDNHISRRGRDDLTEERMEQINDARALYEIGRASCRERV